MNARGGGNHRRSDGIYLALVLDCAKRTLYQCNRLGNNLRVRNPRGKNRLRRKEFSVILVCVLLSS